MSDSRIVGLPFQAIFVSPKVIIVDNNKQLNLKNITEFIIAKQIEHGKKMIENIVTGSRFNKIK